MNIHIDDDLADKITVNNLLSSLQICREQAAELMERESLENFEAQDLANDLRAIRHYEAVLSYYMCKTDYEMRVGKKFPA